MDRIYIDDFECVFWEFFLFFCFLANGCNVFFRFLEKCMIYKIIRTVT